MDSRAVGSIHKGFINCGNNLEVINRWPGVVDKESLLDERDIKIMIARPERSVDKGVVILLE